MSGGTHLIQVCFQSYGLALFSRYGDTHCSSVTLSSKFSEKVVFQSFVRDGIWTWQVLVLQRLSSSHSHLSKAAVGEANIENPSSDSVLCLGWRKL